MNGVELKIDDLANPQRALLAWFKMNSRFKMFVGRSSGIHPADGKQDQQSNSGKISHGAHSGLP